MKKGDVILILTVAVLAIGLWGFSYFQGLVQGASEVIIKSEGEVVTTLEIDATTSASYTVENQYGRNVIWIEAGQVKMHEASCKNQLCVEAGHIHLPGQSIVCLPNRVVVEIKSKKPLAVDAISQ